LDEVEDKALAGHYNSKLSELLDIHAPLVSTNVILKPKVAWFDDEAKSLKLKVRKLYRKWNSSKQDHELTTYKAVRNSYRQHLNASKRTHFQQAIQSARGNPRKLFSITMGLMGKKPDNPLPNSPSNNSLATEFANYFIDKINNIRSSLEVFPYYQPTGSCLSNLNSFDNISEETISKIITNSRATTCELDPIPTNLVKQNQSTLSPLITKIVNASFQQGIFYDIWKTAIVKPLLKKSGLEPVLCNYRPVSNLCYISKIAEKAAIQQLNEYFTANNLNSDHQSA
jgi:hypothetical protein